MPDHVEGVHLQPSDESTDGIDALAGLAGGRAGLANLLADLDRQGHRTWAPGLRGTPRLHLGPRGPPDDPVVAAGHLDLGRRATRHTSRAGSWW